MGEAGHFQNKCGICALPEALLVQVDDILATPPTELMTDLYDGIDPEEIPASAKRWSSVRHAKVWLAERHDKPISTATISNHFDKHLPLVPATMQRIVETGRLADGSQVPVRAEPYLAAVQFHAYFKAGMDIGMRALKVLEKRVIAAEDPESDSEVTNSILLSIARVGQQLATAQAQIWARGQRFDVEDDDAMAGFMGEQPSPRFGSYRVRDVDGEHKPVYDEGPADRQHYNERAREEGGTELPFTG